ncbi:hypothetical protein FHT78_004891 [Rhizobium sp. BK196]|uniref:hypothetical protein n=1 Tax=Rhizobium sp. BK196 TaxID=2587073 RepID=UPI00160AEDB9|nr:hypothetical protein [Rhizobium sp. BK196]MBB3313103.1 hypothetical protein [Rhizobium sp. BK196]
MDSISKVLGALIKGLGLVLGGLVGFGLLLIGLETWANASTERSSYECVVRRMDHHIAEASTGAYHDTCMAALGYRRVGGCYSGNLVAAPSFCFAPSWQFWKS